MICGDHPDCCAGALPRTRAARVVCVGSVFVFWFLACIWAAQGDDAAVILQYHHIDNHTPRATSVTIEQFENHLAYLESHAFNVWPLESIVAHLQAGKDLPPRCIAITMDDAFVSVRDAAFPRLQQRGWPFMIFVTTGGVDNGLRGYLTWDQMRALSAAGVGFGSHSHTHDYLIRRREGETEAAWALRVTEDIERCRRRLTAELGAEPNLFAYPYGEYDGALKQIVLDLGLVGCGQQSGGIWSGSDFGVLPRFPMAAAFADMEGFTSKVNSLPLPVISADPDDPVLAPGVRRPLLRLRLAPGDYRIEQLAAYASGQGRIEVRLIDPERRIIELAPNEPLPAGRSRYNCTAPHTGGARHYWYSHLWIRAGAVR